MLVYTFGFTVQNSFTENYSLATGSVFINHSNELSLACSPEFLYLEEFESNTTFDWLNLWPIKSCVTFRLKKCLREKKTKNVI